MCSCKRIVTCSYTHERVYVSVDRSHKPLRYVIEQCILATQGSRRSFLLNWRLTISLLATMQQSSKSRACPATRLFSPGICPACLLNYLHVQ